MQRITKDTKWSWLALTGVMALAAGLRLYHLDQSAFRADTIMFFDICHQPLSGWVVFTQWMGLVGSTGHFPFPLAITKCFIDVLHCLPNAFMIRLPNALFGVLTVLGMYMLGCQMAGRKFGVLLALWLAVNPFHIQLCREAYFYSPLLLGITLQAWSCLWAYRHRKQRDPFPVRFHIITQVGFFLMIYSHLSGWWIGVFFVLFLGWVLGKRAWDMPTVRNEFWIWCLVSTGLGLPLLFVSWGLPNFLHDLLNPEVKEQGKRIMGGLQTPLAPFVWQLLESASWGGTPLRSGLLMIIAGMTLAGLVVNRHRNYRAWIIFLFLLSGFLIYWLGLVLIGVYYGQRHVAFLLPLYLSVMAYGVWHLSSFSFMRRLIISPGWRRMPAYGVALIAVALNVQPAWVCTQLTGKPIPYKEVVRWCDTQLPRHTLVLVERWLDPWNELRVHNSTNVYFTFTVPAEPKDVFERFNWPVTAKQFFNRFPDAAYLEFCNSERRRMGVVTNVYFARRVAFTNEAGIRLAKWGVAYREEFYDPSTNRLITTLFYNTREDVIRHAREQGQTVLVLYGPEWGYVKLWQQLKDFRDWRVLEDQAILDVYNLTSRTNGVSVVIRGMAVNGSKRVNSAQGAAHDFKRLQLEEWSVGRWALRPGLNQIVLKDPFWRLSQIPLLVDEVWIREAKPEQSPQ